MVWTVASPAEWTQPSNRAGFLCVFYVYTDGTLSLTFIFDESTDNKKRRRLNSVNKTFAFFLPGGEVFSVKSPFTDSSRIAVCSCLGFA